MAPSKTIVDGIGPDHIVIDARSIGSSTGTVLRTLLPHIERIDSRRRYTVIIKRRDQEIWKPTAPNFSTELTDVEDFSFGVQSRYLSLLNRVKADLVWFFMPEQPLLYRGRVVTTFHDFTMQTTPPTTENRRLRSYLKLPIGRFAFWFAARKSAIITCPSDYTRTKLIERYGTNPKKVRTVHNGAEVSPRPSAEYQHGFDRFLLYVGQHGWHKNVKRLCLAHQRLVDTRPGLGLIFVGKIDPFMQRTKTWCEQRGMRNILFTGFLADEQRDGLYRAAASYVFPSLAEGFGLPGVEAMRYGTPVVSSNATCLPEIYGDAAEYFDPEDVNDMVRAIGLVLNDPSRRSMMIERGFVRSSCYSNVRMAEKMVSIFDEALRNAKS